MSLKSTTACTDHRWMYDGYSIVVGNPRAQVRTSFAGRITQDGISGGFTLSLTMRNEGIL